MTHRTARAALAALGLSMVVAAPAIAQVDVKAYLIPVVNPGEVNPNSIPPEADDRYHLELDPNITPNYHIEIWINDLGALNTGVISAYTDVSWDNGAITDALSLHHEAAFNLLIEGSIDNATDMIANFGGTNPSFAGQGIDQYVRVGYIDFDASGVGIINFEGVIGAGEYGVSGRSIGAVEIRGAEVIIPEPASIIFASAGLGGLLLRRNRSAR